MAERDVLLSEETERELAAFFHAGGVIHIRFARTGERETERTLKAFRKMRAAIRVEMQGAVSRTLDQALNSGDGSYRP